MDPTADSFTQSRSRVTRYGSLPRDALSYGRLDCAILVKCIKCFLKLLREAVLVVFQYLLPCDNE
jgi:hypothetical protein